MCVRVASQEHRLSPQQARQLRDALTEAVAGRRTYLRTAGEHRPDGSYVVERVGADSAGHRKVFDRFADLQAVFEQLPERFTAEDVQRVVSALSGGRCHLLVRHFAEHPAFACQLASRQPLTGRKTEPDRSDETVTAKRVAAATESEPTDRQSTRATRDAGATDD